ncbi:MAG: aldo/keto reductase [Prosthecochloris sp.]|uniref:Aldo/keto reductase n=1 Tax=Prosthecochloris aestuarii (strain DSM 271 / SK 413) TaxID=290512 RepID=B4S7A5_PROA2|nr:MULTISPECIES: aldo/keto reductase [Prosthecochloris]ACF45942.1 aldo/keto reductase [Prosthecochloris aestuarii DSM 271]MCW8798652.1 aldo/keto reductase [Prosthecochloris sp.]NEX12470.1 aldo/keto reductase [Prosthecochloris sp.]
MNTVRLGRTDLDITPVGFGCWAIGGGNWAYGWGPQNDHQAIEAIIAATELGINWIDTAAVYGLGHAEELVGEALRGMNNRPLIFTKCSLVWDTSRNVTNCLKADSILRECEASLKRLGIEAIDLYQVHWPNPDEDIEEGWQTLAKLQEEGLVRHIGVSNFSVEQMQRAEAIAPVASLQPPYSMLRRGIEEKILPYCQEHNIGVIVYSPMLSGMLSGAMTLDRALNLPKNDWRRNNKEFQEPRLSKNIALVELLRSIGRAYEASPGEVAIAWTLNNPAVTGAIVGGRSAEQVKGTYGAASLRLTDEDIQAIEKFIASVAE